MHLDPTAFVADSELIRTLAARAMPVDSGIDRVLFLQDDPADGLYILLDGEVELSMISQRGKPVFSARAIGGSILGLPGLIGNQPYSLTAVARAGAQVSFLPRAAFAAIMKSDPMLAFRILQVLAAEVHSARQALC